MLGQSTGDWIYAADATLHGRDAVFVSSQAETSVLLISLPDLAVVVDLPAVQTKSLLHC
jgi:hypothetical protein